MKFDTAAGPPALSGGTVNKTASFTAAFDVGYTVDATSGAVTVTPPTGNYGTFWLKKTDATANTVTFSGTVDGVSNPVLSYQGQVMEVVWTGAAWEAKVRPYAAYMNDLTSFLSLVAAGALSNPMSTKGDLIAGGASGVVNRLGIGADTQVLTADSAQTLGVKWAASASGFANPMTTKGDVIAAASGGTATRLAVGADGTVLTADSTQAVGAKWAAALTNPMTTKGDMIAGASAGAANRLPVGTDGYGLVADSTQTVGVKWAQGVQRAVITADLSPISSQTTLQALSALSFAIGSSATEIWIVRYWLLYTGTATTTEGIKIGLQAVPASCTARGGVVGAGGSTGGWTSSASAGSSSAILTESTTTGLATLSGQQGTKIEFVVFGGGTAGNVVLGYAQQNSLGTNLTINKGSMVEYVQVHA